MFAPRFITPHPLVNPRRQACAVPGSRQQQEKIKGRGPVGKAVVMGLLERHGEVRTEVIPNRKKGTIDTHVRQNVEKGSEVFTDELRSYDDLKDEYAHQVINHAESYAEGKIHTNGLENYWSLFKRCIHGTYVSIEPFHLFRYLDEQEFRFNRRSLTDAARFNRVVRSVVGRSLKYAVLIGDQ